MGRRSSGSSGRSAAPSRGFASRSQPTTQRNSAPAPHAGAAPPAPAQSGGFMGNLASNIVGGMASGVGFSMANRAVDAVMGPRQMEMVHRNEDAPAPMSQPGMQQANSNVCQVQQEQLNQCLGQAGDMTHCSFYFDMLKQCQQAPMA